MALALYPFVFWEIGKGSASEPLDGTPIVRGEYSRLKWMD